MADPKDLKEAFEASIKSNSFTGMLKFSNLYCSQFDVYKAVKQWADEDKNLIYANLWHDGESFITLNFRYDFTSEKEIKKYKSLIYDFFKPLFEKKMGADYIQAWSSSLDPIIVK